MSNQKYFAINIKAEMMRYLAQRMATMFVLLLHLHLVSCISRALLNAHTFLTENSRTSWGSLTLDCSISALYSYLRLNKSNNRRSAVSTAFFILYIFFYFLYVRSHSFTHLIQVSMQLAVSYSFFFYDHYN